GGGPLVLTFAKVAPARGGRMLEPDHHPVLFHRTIAAILPRYWRTQRWPRRGLLAFCPHIQSNGTGAGQLERFAARNAVTRTVRAAALRSTALATCLVLAAAFCAPAEAAPKVPLPKPRPIARNVAPATTAAIVPATPKNTEKNTDKTTQKTAAAGPLQLAHA